MARLDDIKQAIDNGEDVANNDARFILAHATPLTVDERRGLRAVLHRAATYNTLLGDSSNEWYDRMIARLEDS